MPQSVRLLRRLAKARERQKRIKIKLRKVSYLDPHESLEPAFKGTLFDFKIIKRRDPKKFVVGRLKYYPDYIASPEIHVKEMDVMHRKGFKGEFFQIPWSRTIGHERFGGRTLSRSDVRSALEQVAKRFPKAKWLRGGRITGIHQGANVEEQVFNLEALRKRMARRK